MTIAQDSREKLELEYSVENRDKFDTLEIQREKDNLNELMAGFNQLIIENPPNEFFHPGPGEYKI